MASSSVTGLMQAVAEFNAEAVQKEFTEHYRRGNLENGLHLHWSQYVPAVYLPSQDPDPAREERKAKRVLFRPLESFLCGGVPEPDAILRSLKERDNPPQLCGRVFKNGEPTYACRDCGMDPTCVLCIECFQHSAHRNHRYKMSTSGGAGYCDCGDMEAWKSEPFCNVHKRGATKNDKDPKDPINNLDEEMRHRAHDIFLILVRYSVTMLTWEKPEELPQSLKPIRTDNTFSTILFNDEVHTYDQVISSLERAIDCSHKEAVDIATTVDREGRSCIRNGSRESCELAKTLMEKNTSRLGSKPLKVVVMHTTVVAHQTFAQKILTWLQHIMNYSDGLRQLFCKLSMTPGIGDETSLVERVMMADTQLWKSARILSHQLFMAGVLMDTECKKQFAIIFTKMYSRLMRNFISDDHDFTVSAAAESVQIFTVPTLARMLITDYNLLAVILNTFLEECEKKKNANGKFSLERSDRNQSFRRAQYMLYDLKYALTTKPTSEEWNDKLRKNFMNGYRSMLELLKCMQCMDSVTRQTGQHIEYEPEWDGAFNLQLKLADDIAEILDWCSTDELVLTEAFATTNEALYEIKDRMVSTKTDKCTVGNHSANCIKYDVSSQPVSIHLPVTRLLAGLYPLMNKLNLSLPVMHRQTKLDIISLMEPVLRTQVMIAQSQAGMWRRNGYSLLNQIYFYQNVRCRTEMADKDLLMLQTAASLVDSNELLVHFINKYGLLNWARQDYDSVKLSAEDLVRQTVTIAEEFLLLLIHVVSERYLEGVGEVDRKAGIKREIIHQLCIQPMAHSELTKALPEDPNHETGIEGAVHEVAIFKKPSGSGGKGLYELKPECYNEYNVYFYHYIRAEQSKAEEAQKKRKKNSQGEEPALAPPYPPAFVEGFAPIIHLLDCDVMLLIMRNILERTLAQKSRSWSESQFEKVLHLIGIALHEERRAYEKNHKDFAFIEKATTGEKNLFTMLESLVGNANITHDSQKDLLNWVISTFRDIRRLKDPVFTEAGPSSMVVDTEAKLQDEKRVKAEMAAKRRQKIMDQMSRMQRDFIKENAELFESAESGLKAAGSDMDISASCDDDHQPVALGPHRSAPAANAVMKQTCILCQEEQEITHNSPAMVISAFTQKSTVLSKARGTVIEDGDTHDPLIVPTTLNEGVHTNTCTHVMHSVCWQRFYDSIVWGRRRAARLRQRLSYDIEKVEFLCPLCETLSNTVIPLIPPLNTFIADSHLKHIDLSLNDWLDGLQKMVRCSIQEHQDKEAEGNNSFFAPCPLSGVTKMMADSVAKNFQLLFEYVYLDSSDHFSDSIMSMLRKFARDVYAVGLGVNPDDDNLRVPIMAWSTCAYTIMTAEQGLRDEGKPLFGELASRKVECLSAIVRFSAVCSQVLHPEIVKKHCVSLLSATILDSRHQKLCETPNILDIDMVHYLVMLCLSLPTLYTDNSDPTSGSALARIPVGDINDLHILQLVFAAHLIQILLSADFSHIEESMDTETDAEGEALVQAYAQLCRYAMKEVVKVPSAWQLSVYLRNACLPFLRCAALFFHYLTGVKPPPKLTERCEDEEEALCKYLALPLSPASLLSQINAPIFNEMIKSWCCDETVRQRLATNTPLLLEYPLVVNRLVSLPQDYSELINKVCTFTCPKSDGDDSRAPTMCLVCGKMLCSQSYCCQTDIDGETVGAATAHTITCGAGTGMFLRVRECQVLLLSNRGKGCFFPPPYLDDYGETDQGLRRGNPLHLCPSRYTMLQRLWLSHSIMEEIAHSLESNTNLHTIDWQHL